MKLVRYGAKGKERPGALDADGTIRDLSGMIDDIGPVALSPGSLARLRETDLQSLPPVAPQRLGTPVAHSRKFLAIGTNYRRHADEAGMPHPAEPILFTKAISCLSGPDDDILLPPGATQLDWEVELGVIIGSVARHVARADALAHVAGYCVVNDVSERAYQLARGGSWDKGKGYDSFGPVGPWLVTADEIPDPQALELFLEVNGTLMQSGNTADMIFGIADIISYVSRFITLEPGDIIATGTPHGVGMGMTPPRFLAAGDRLRLGIRGLGEQNQTVVPDAR